MKDGYYECTVCTRCFKVVDGEIIELNLKRNIDEILSNNVIIINCGRGKHIKSKNIVKDTMKAKNEKKLLQDNSRYHSFL